VNKIAHRNHQLFNYSFNLFFFALYSVAINRTIISLEKQGTGKLESFEYTDTRIAREIYEAMDATQFLGVSVQ